MLPSFLAHFYSLETNDAAIEEFFGQGIGCYAVDISRQSPSHINEIKGSQPYGYASGTSEEALLCPIIAANEHTLDDLLCTMIQVKKALLDQAQFISAHYFGVNTEYNEELQNGLYLRDAPSFLALPPCFEIEVIVRK